MIKLTSAVNIYQRYLLTGLTACLLILTIYSCSKNNNSGGGGGNTGVVDPQNRAKLADALKNSFPAGTQVKEGVLPVSSPGAPEITPSGAPNSNVVSGNSVDNIRFSVANFPFQGRLSSTSQNNISGCYVILDGFTNYYWNVPAPDTTTTEWTLPLSIPSNVGTGDFTLQICVYNSAGLISPPLTWDITVVNPNNNGGGGGGGTGNGSATVTVNGSTYNADYCYLTNVPDSISQGCYETAVYIGFDNNTKGLIIYNVPTGSGGSIGIANYCDEFNDNDGDGDACWNGKTIAFYNSDVTNSNQGVVGAWSVSGNFSKTGSNSFTVNNLVLENFDINTNSDCGFSGSSVSISVTGTYVITPN